MIGLYKADTERGSDRKRRLNLTNVVWQYPLNLFDPKPSAISTPSTSIFMFLQLHPKQTIKGVVMGSQFLYYYLRKAP